jgi:hypothetical protein
MYRVNMLAMSLRTIWEFDYPHYLFKVFLKETFEKQTNFDCKNLGFFLKSRGRKVACNL